MGDMFCPKCGAEYREGFTVCSDCGVGLVEGHPPEPEFVEFVTVYRSGNPALLALAKSILEDAGIPYVVRGEGLQDLFAWGRMGIGFNPLVGPPEIQVDIEDKEEAVELLEQLG